MHVCIHICIFAYIYKHTWIFIYIYPHAVRASQTFAKVSLLLNILYAQPTSNRLRIQKTRKSSQVTRLFDGEKKMKACRSLLINFNQKRPADFHFLFWWAWAMHTHVGFAVTWAWSCLFDNIHEGCRNFTANVVRRTRHSIKNVPKVSINRVVSSHKFISELTCQIFYL